MNDAPAAVAAPTTKRVVVTNEKLTNRELSKLRECLKQRRALRSMVKQAEELGRRLASEQVAVHKSNDELADIISQRLGFESFRALMDKGFSIGVEPCDGSVALMQDVPL